MNRGQRVKTQRNAGAQPKTKRKTDPHLNSADAATVGTDFLKKLQPQGPWVLTAIMPDGPTITESFTPSSDLLAEAFIRKHNGIRNIYYSINEAQGLPTKKTNKADIARVHFLHADIDPLKDETSEAAKARLMPIAEDFIPRPTAIIDSGNGIQALWRIEEPIQNTWAALPSGEERDRALGIVEDRNRALAEGFGADPSTRNVDRIFRLPGTINLPNKAKRELGRTQCDSKLISFTDDAYPLSLFPVTAAPQVRARPNGAIGEDAFPDELPPVDVDQLDLSERLLETIKDGRYEDFKDDRSRALWFVINQLRWVDQPDLVIASIILDPRYRISEHVRAQSNPRRYAEYQLRKAPRPGPMVSDTNHIERATTFRDLQRPHIQRFRDDFLDYAHGRYEAVGDNDVNAEIWRFLDTARARRVIGKKSSIVAFLPNTRSVNETIAALKAISKRNDRSEPPFWIDGREKPLPSELISFPNGLLDIRTGKLHPPDPKMFTVAAAGFDYDPEAPEAQNWLGFLDQIYAGDGEQIALLQEFFGYILLPGTTFLDLQKAGLIIGPPRSGKGVQLAMMRALLPPTSCVGPTLQSLGTNFGLQPLIGKQLAIVDDLQLGSRAEQAELVSNVKKMTGSGWFTIDRKYKEAWTGMLPTKLVLVANELPQLGDNSGATAERFIIFETRQSFLGKEDERLFNDNLLPERQGVLLWAIEGLRRLIKQRRFTESKTSVGLRRRLKMYGSPVQAFIMDEFDFDPNGVAWKDETFHAWKTYAMDNGYPIGDEAHFSIAVFSASSGQVKASKPHDPTTKMRRPAYLGIRRKPVDNNKII